MTRAEKEVKQVQLLNDIIRQCEEARNTVGAYSILINAEDILYKAHKLYNTSIEEV